MTTTTEPATPPPFAAGDIVLLKSGGPSMTVYLVRPVGAHWHVETVWFSDRVYCHGCFGENELVKP